MNTNIDTDFCKIIEAAVAAKRYIKIHYYTDIREYISKMAVASEVFSKDGEEYLRLASGEEIRLDHIARIDDDIAPPYAGLYEFSCDC